MNFARRCIRSGCTAVMSRTRMTVGLRPGSFAVDLDEILAAVAAREAPEALLHQERLAETLLAGYEISIRRSTSG